MKKIVILFGKKTWKNTTLFEKKIYQESYEYFYDLARKKGLDFYRASYEWYDPQKKFFKYAWTFKRGTWQRAWNIVPDLVYDKTKFSTQTHLFKEVIAQDYALINDPEFTLIANNKLLMSLIMPSFFKKYHKIYSQKDLAGVIKKLSGKKIVLKPIYGSGGEAVQIIDKKNIRKLKITSPLIAQEFIDSSCGISGLVNGCHDLRLVFINDQLIYSYIRQPKKGSLLANLAQGGSMFIVEKKDIPSSVNSLVKEFQSIFSFYNPKIYTIDIIFDKSQTPWIVEINTMPGIYFSPDQYSWRDKFYSEVIRVLKNFRRKKD